MKESKYNFLRADRDIAFDTLGAEYAYNALSDMVLIRKFEIAAERGYRSGHIGGFLHTYIGQEAIQTAATYALGVESHWWATSYRCHGLALLLGMSPAEGMAELHGKGNGNAKGRGGSMHFYSDRMLGGYGIVGGQVSISTGAAFALKYQGEKGISVCFLGDGGFAQGVVHESLNIASLWGLPCLYVIENNGWGMGTAVDRAICSIPIAEKFAPAYSMAGYTLDGTDFIDCYSGFLSIHREMIEHGRPILVEVLTNRFRGHSISDTEVYRSRDDVRRLRESADPINKLQLEMVERGMLDGERFAAIEKAQQDIVDSAVAFAINSPDPEIASVGDGVYAGE